MDEAAMGRPPVGITVGLTLNHGEGKSQTFHTMIGALTNNQEEIERLIDAAWVRVLASARQWEERNSDQPYPEKGGIV